MLPGRGSTDFRDFTEATEASAMMTRLGQVSIYLSICSVFLPDKVSIFLQ